MYKDLYLQLEQLINTFSKTIDTDIVIFNGPINSDTFTSFRNTLNSRDDCRANVLLCLLTYGGSPDDGYRLARILQSNYSKFSIYIPDLCKSTGTLVALGASEIIMGQFGELGPLDMQLRKADELWETSSGLNLTSAFSQLESRTLESFSRFFIEMKGRFQFSTKTATEISCRLSEGIYKGISDQIDPIHIGETNRSILIAQQYGESLNKYAKNLKENALARLIAGYPSHGYVIDLEEAKQLFNNIRLPENEESRFFDSLLKLLRVDGIIDSSQDNFIIFVQDFAKSIKEHGSLYSPDASYQNEEHNGKSQNTATEDNQNSEAERSSNRGLNQQIESNVFKSDKAKASLPPAPTHIETSNRQNSKDTP